MKVITGNKMYLVTVLNVSKKMTGKELAILLRNNRQKITAWVEL